MINSSRGDCPMRNKHNLFLISFGALFFIWSALPALTEISQPQWSLISGPASNIKPLPGEKQFFLYNEQLNLAVLEEGKLDLYSYSEAFQWQKYQSIELPEIQFTTFLVKDINNDNRPEIIAGTYEPGFIHIYTRGADENWIMMNYNKYIWSTISRLVCGRFTGPGSQNLVAQNTEGYLFLLKISENSLDLIWKSPVPWRMIDTAIPMDVDKDKDLSNEIVAVYKNGGMGVLKIANNAIASSWENYPWGKILAVNYYDWNNNTIPELIVTTTQKMVCLFEMKNKTYQASRQTQFDYLIEKLYFPQIPGKRVFVATDTAGKTHVAEYSIKNKKWVETQMFPTGRILQIIDKGSQELLLINQSYQTAVLKYSKE
jgi:hypothetical protein